MHPVAPAPITPLSTPPGHVNAEAPGSGDVASPAASSAPVPRGYVPDPGNAWRELEIELGKMDGSRGPEGGTLEAKPWWQSKTILGVVLIVVVQLLERAGFRISADDPALTALVADVLSLIGGALTIYGRTRAIRPVTSGVSAKSAVLLVWALMFLASLLMSGCTTAAGGLQGSLTIGYGDASVTYRNDGPAKPVVLVLPTKEGLSK